MAGLLELTVAQAAARIAAGEVSRGEYFEAWREAAAGDELNAYLWRAEEGTGEGDGPLGGIPVAIKDLFCTEGIETTAGSRILAGHRPLYTATAVRRLGEAGAGILGKTNMDEFAMGSSNENSGYGPVRNPWDTGRVPGGSSGGSAAAVAAGLAPCAIGTDTGGSIRVPASFCGLYGLRPTHGRIDAHGATPMAPSYDTIGFLARDAELARTLGQVLLEGEAVNEPITRLILAQDIVGESEASVDQALWQALDKLAGVIPKAEHAEIAGEDIVAWRKAFATIQGFEIQSTLLPLSLIHI